MYVDNDHRGYLTINDIHPEDAKRLQLIIQQADKQLLSHSIEVLGETTSLTTHRTCFSYTK